MWNYKQATRVDWKIIIVLMALMLISLLVISSTTQEPSDIGAEQFFTPYTKSQLKWYCIGWGVFFFFSGIDYRKLRWGSWFLYGLMILLLFGLFFTTPIQNVQRWYRIPFVGFAFQPSEYAKLVVSLTLALYLESKVGQLHSKSTIIGAVLIVLVPFFLILKEPDLGTALVLYPIALVMFYFGGLSQRLIRWMTGLVLCGIGFVSLIFLNILPHEEMRPYVTKVIKEYQFERLNPNTYHQQSSQTAIALGGLTGTGWMKSEYTGKHWLPAAHTDSVFAAYAEEFGFIGVFVLMALFFALVFFNFQIASAAQDRFGKLLASGITTYLAMHIIVNVGMMCGFLPITGVPLILITYGGSSIVSTMMALGILQSIYTRRFMF